MNIKLLILLVFTPISLLWAQNAEIAFTLTEKDLIPEGITYDQAGKSFYIGSIHKKKVIQIDAKGNVADFITTNQDGMGEVLGMHIDNKRRQLWICNNEVENKPDGKSSVYVYDLRSAKLAHKYDLKQEKEMHLFNDVIVLSSGDGYVTDSDAGSIYKVDPLKGTIELFIKEDRLQYCNGITTSPDERTLIVSTGKGLLGVDIATKELSRINTHGYLVIADGLYRYKNTLIAIQNIFFPESIVQFQLNQLFDQVEKHSALAVNLPQFNIPTTGVVVGDWFYFIANSQLDQRENGTLRSPQNLKDVNIMKVKLGEE